MNYPINQSSKLLLLNASWEAILEGRHGIVIRLAASSTKASYILRKDEFDVFVAADRVALTVHLLAPN